MRIIGVSGPTGSGKSVLTEHFASLGVPTVDADALYHSMLIPPSDCLDAIRASFGDEVFSHDGSLDRTALGALVFANPEKLKLLNSTVLGLVLKRIRELIGEYEKNGANTVVIDAPTLIESGFHLECDTVISVIAPSEDRVIRICQRDGITEKKARERVAAQKDDVFYTSHSHHTIYTNGSIDQFLDTVRAVASKLIN